MDHNKLQMEYMGNKEVMFFHPSTGKLHIHTSKPTASADPDKVVAVKMNDPESGGFFKLFNLQLRLTRRGEKPTASFIYKWG